MKTLPDVEFLVFVEGKEREKERTMRTQGESEIPGNTNLVRGGSIRSKQRGRVLRIGISEDVSRKTVHSIV